jgi:outer membrane protein assembly factor BamB
VPDAPRTGDLRAPEHIPRATAAATLVIVRFTAVRPSAALLPPVLVAVVLAALGGCGGSGSHTTTTTKATTSPPAVAPPHPRRAVHFVVSDGDTGRPVAGAVVSAPGAIRRGASLLVLRKAKALVVTARAPHYGSLQERIVPGRGAIKLTLYRSDGQWLLYGGDPARTQSQPAIRLRPPFHIAWARYLGSLIEYPAVVDQGVAYLNNLSGHLFALSMQTGKTVWEVNMHSREQDSSPGVVGPMLVAHVKTGRVMVVRRSTGKVMWDYPTSGEIESSPVVEHGIDYLGDWAGDVYALDLRTHRARWVYHDGCKVTASMAIAGPVIYFGDYCGRVVALRRSDGRPLWTASAGSPVYGTSAVAGGRVFVPSRDAGALYAFSKSGAALWHVSTGGLVYSAPAVWHGRVYFGSYTGELYCVSASSGAVLWRLQVGGPISGSPTVIDGVVYVGSFAHRIVGADARTGRTLFTFPHGEYVAVSGNRGKLLLYGWASLWAVTPATRRGG